MARKKRKQQQHYRVSIASHNAARGNADFPALADIILHQEVAGEDARDKLRRALPGYNHWFIGEMCISIKHDKFIAKKKKARKIVDGRAKIGPDRWQQRWDIRLRAAPRTQLRIINTHLTNGVQKRKWPFIWRKRAHNRGRVMFAQAGRFHKAARKFMRAIALGGGDLNWKNEWDIIKNWTAVRHKQGSPGYDRLLFIPHPRLELLRSWQGKRHGSDHAAIHAVFRVTAVEEPRWWRRRWNRKRRRKQ